MTRSQCTAKLGSSSKSKIIDNVGSVAKNKTAYKAKQELNDPQAKWVLLNPMASQRKFSRRGSKTAAMIIRDACGVSESPLIAHGGGVPPTFPKYESSTTVKPVLSMGHHRCDSAVSFGSNTLLCSSPFEPIRRQPHLPKQEEPTLFRGFSFSSSTDINVPALPTKGEYTKHLGKHDSTTSPVATSPHFEHQP